MASTFPIPAESRDYHRKGQTNLRLSDDGRAYLNALAEYYGLGTSGIVEMLIRERAHEKGLKPVRNATKRRKRRS